MTTTNDLGTFEDRSVTKTTIAVRNAGDGLSQAMKVNPQKLHQGDTVYVVLECKVGPVSFDPIKDSETECERRHILRAGAATLIDDQLVKEAIAKQTEAIIAARDEEAGRSQLPEKDLAQEHRDGLHANPIGKAQKDCELCNAEKADKAEARTGGKTRASSAAKRAPAKKPAAKKAPAKKAAAKKS